MKVQRDPYLTWISGKAIAFTWVGAFLAPFVWQFPRSNPMFWLALGAIVLVILSIWQGIAAMRQAVTSDFLAMTVVPILILAVAGTINVLAA
jgi:hypothetical protein